MQIDQLVTYTDQWVPFYPFIATINILDRL